MRETNEDWQTIVKSSSRTRTKPERHSRCSLSLLTLFSCFIYIYSILSTQRQTKEYDGRPFKNLTCSKHAKTLSSVFGPYFAPPSLVYIFHSFSQH